MPSKVALHAGTRWQGALQIDCGAARAALRKQRDGFATPTANRSREISGDKLLQARARFLSGRVKLVVDKSKRG